MKSARVSRNVVVFFFRNFDWRGIGFEFVAVWTSYKGYGNRKLRFFSSRVGQFVIWALRVISFGEVGVYTVYVG